MNSLFLSRMVNIATSANDLIFFPKIADIAFKEFDVIVLACNGSYCLSLRHLSQVGL